jgi:hypothetical protein
MKIWSQCYVTLCYESYELCYFIFLVCIVALTALKCCSFFKHIPLQYLEYKITQSCKDILICYMLLHPSGWLQRFRRNRVPPSSGINYLKKDAPPNVGNRLRI